MKQKQGGGAERRQDAGAGNVYLRGRLAALARRRAACLPGLGRMIPGERGGVAKVGEKGSGRGGRRGGVDRSGPGEGHQWGRQVEVKLMAWRAGRSKLRNERTNDKRTGQKNSGSTRPCLRSRPGRPASPPSPPEAPGHSPKPRCCHRQATRCPKPDTRRGRTDMCPRVGEG